MKFFTKKGFGFKLIVVLFLMLMVFNFTFSTVSNADTWNFNSSQKEATTGGKLLTPVVDLLLGLGDAIIMVIQKAIMGTSSAVTIDTSTKIIVVILSVILAIVVVGLAVYFLGPLLAGVAALKILAGAAGVAKLALAIGTFYVAYTGLSGAMLSNPTLIPTYSISPEEICRGDILLFDVNIFNPKKVWVQLAKQDLSEGEGGSVVTTTTTGVGEREREVTVTNAGETTVIDCSKPYEIKLKISNLKQRDIFKIKYKGDDTFSSKTYSELISLTTDDSGWVTFNNIEGFVWNNVEYKIGYPGLIHIR